MREEKEEEEGGLTRRWGWTWGYPLNRHKDLSLSNLPRFDFWHEISSFPTLISHLLHLTPSAPLNEKEREGGGGTYSICLASVRIQSSIIV